MAEHVTEKDVRDIATYTRIGMTDEEVAAMTVDLNNIIETLHALDAVAPGTANYATLLYGIECKYYSARPQTENFKLCGCENIYAVGDGAGFTRSLSQAAANGLYVADLLCEQK